MITTVDNKGGWGAFPGMSDKATPVILVVDDDAGASDFIVKPFSLDELKAKICRIHKKK